MKVDFPAGLPFSSDGLSGTAQYKQEGQRGRIPREWEGFSEMARHVAVGSSILCC